MTRDLLDMVSRLLAKGVTPVPMESTGVYWKPIYNLLEATGVRALVARQTSRMRSGLPIFCGIRSGN